MINIPVSELPRERLLRDGIEALSIQELLAILLGTGTRGKNVLILAQELLLHFGGMKGLLESSVDDLMQINGIGHAKAILLKAAFGLALRCTKESFEPFQKIKKAEEAFRLAKSFIGHFKQEALLVILRDVKGRVIRQELIGMGTLSEVLVHPREVFNPAVRHRANSLILVHNHPSGDPTPSTADLQLTKHLLYSSKIMGIFFDDHLIIGENRYTSLRESGFLGNQISYG
ncbi:MAG: DNA repair protein RadC [Chlamydiae bacterium]|nr:DNA repair protein RadC [Chlamydiota bacterium]